MQVTATITFTVESPDQTTGQQAIAAFAEPWIRQTTGQQIARTESGAYDLDSVKALGKEALRQQVTAAYLAEQATRLEAAKAAQLETIRTQATASMSLEVAFQ
jgi:hypothetical protein